MLKTSVRRENIWYAVNLAVSLLVLCWLYSIIVDLRTSAQSRSLLTIVLIYLVIIIAYVFLAKGLLVGHFRGNGVRVGERQFPEVYRVYQEQIKKLEIKNEPKLYCVQSGGVLNAFATRMFFRNYVVIYTEILQAAYDKGMDAVAFVLAHELGHVKRGHLVKNIFIYPAAVILPFRFAYSRACEYTCDVIGRETTSERGVAGLLILAAGSRLSRIVNTEEYLEKAAEERGFWVWFAEFMSTHPNLPKRIRRLRSFEAAPAQR